MCVQILSFPNEKKKEKVFVCNFYTKKVFFCIIKNISKAHQCAVYQQNNCKPIYIYIIPRCM